MSEWDPHGEERRAAMEAAIAAAPSRPVWASRDFVPGKALRAAVAAKTKGRCFYCGKRAATDLDHKTPWIRRGSDEIENLVLACSPCNTSKGFKTVDEFRIWQMLRKGRPPNPFHGEQAERRRRDWLIVVKENVRAPLWPPRPPSGEARRIWDRDHRDGKTLKLIAKYLGAST